ncbi:MULTISPECIES: acyl carrier protein [unclassified Roseateles]|uniref:acyl carrier protein n=1 Tax=Roseateles TaxID=93681 RepID=UPI0007DE0445|nr:acyl carrier protein [Mitsuaria sp. 7]ANH69430.1 acyl carrier protein [Mitsuaria sp. 7]OWQ46683.1 acyl carrier protein [Roseateles noduli]
MTNEDIFARLRDILIETFDIEADRITPEARLYEDLDIDSIDAVDLIVKLKPMVGKKLQPEAFKAVRTLQDVVDALQGLIKTPETAGA